MTLRRKLLILNATLLIGVLTIVGFSLAGLSRQQSHVEASLREYAALQLVESAEVRVVGVKARLHEADVTAGELLPELRVALDELRSYKAMLGMYDHLLPPEIDAGQQADAKARTRSAAAKLAALVSLLEATPASPIRQGPQATAIAADADALTADLAGLLRVCNTFLNRTGLESDRDLRRAIIPVACLAIVLPLGAILISVWQYRRIMIPLHRLREGSRRIAAGDFSHRYEPAGPQEFVQLGRDFNEMAGELQAFYRKLEEMVAVKSRELVRSERLASVGYLAAGVAHEINSPLNIISGYAELSAKRLRRASDEAPAAELLNWQTLIRDEAFRCKQITGKLLSLSRGGNEGREVVSLTRVASDVAVMVRGLRNFRGRRLNVAIDPAHPFEVHANVTEMKQVMLNLIVNALEAVTAGSGEVVVDARGKGEWIEFTVSDNGRGMDATTLDRVFEPFYTNKRGVGEAGTGLGLSITYAIIAEHGGQIGAESDGPGHGSRFSIRLPAAATTTEARINTPKNAQTHGSAL